MNIIGRVTKDAQVHTLSNEKQVVNFSIATNENYRNKQGESVEQATFFDCAYWISPKVATFLTKGTLVELTGNVSARAWTGKDGVQRASLNFLTSQIKLHGGGKKGENPTTESRQDTNRAKNIEVTGNETIHDDLPF
ncbi:single-stranded DNA-binding protein [Flavobacterium sp. DG1-102-2]|uniref:single-stranded DNA-binding protein n=1 Tax=Flavobacterium sp. DG1-102-2 TaxID=3081663 RepID=UPI002948C5DE|nr:single-stranded DNA-binding protein [Flavobacterium sp. DG1-102-2]MDV6167111.1 single-stranded DNA-binding protein [Flavobacterium sp. DG1-102-2]